MDIVTLAMIYGLLGFSWTTYYYFRWYRNNKELCKKTFGSKKIQYYFSVGLDFFLHFTFFPLGILLYILVIRKFSV